MQMVERGVDSARSAGDALANIIQGSEAVQKRVAQVAIAAAQQSSATQSVNVNLNEISSIIEHTTNSSARSVVACDRLANLAADLNELVGSFKVRDEQLYGRNNSQRAIDLPVQSTAIIASGWSH
jgi:methyl-accepting chemotaxis protein